MKEQRLPNLLREKTRHGKLVWYYREKDGPRTRLHGEYGSKEFLAAYKAASEGRAYSLEQGRDKSSNGSLKWLVRRYRESSAWSKMAPGTRRSREVVLRQLEAIDRPYASIAKKDIVLGMEDRAEKLTVANHFLKTTRAMFKWAVSSDLVDEDPTSGLKKYREDDSDGYHTWTEGEVASFRDVWPVGTRERLMFEILLQTGLRKGDALMFGRQHIKDGIASLKTEKTGTWVAIPLSQSLAGVLEASKTGDLTFFTTVDGRRMAKTTFNTWFKEVCRKAGVPGSAHGLRKTCATRLAEAGATIHELNAIFGWVGTQMASLYTQEADKKRLAIQGMAKLRVGMMEQEENEPAPHLVPKCGVRRV